MATAATEVKKDISSLRATLEWLDSEGDLLKTDVEVEVGRRSPVGELTASREWKQR